MRPLGLKDVFALSAIIDKLGFENELKTLIAKTQDNMSELEGLTEEQKATKLNAMQNDIGIEMIMKLVASAHKADKEVFKFIASIKEISIKEAENLSIEDLIQLGKDLFNQGDSLKAIFTSAVETE